MHALSSPLPRSGIGRGSVIVLAAIAMSLASLSSGLACSRGGRLGEWSIRINDQ